MVCISDGSLEIGRHGVGALPRVVEVLLRSARKIFWVLVLRCKAVATSETTDSSSAEIEAIRESAEVLRWCPRAESNHRHHDFQSPDLCSGISLSRYREFLQAAFQPDPV